MLLQVWRSGPARPAGSVSAGSPRRLGSARVPQHRPEGSPPADPDRSPSLSRISGLLTHRLGQTDGSAPPNTPGSPRDLIIPPRSPRRPRRRVPWCSETRSSSGRCPWRPGSLPGLPHRPGQALTFSTSLPSSNEALPMPPWITPAWALVDLAALGVLHRLRDVHRHRADLGVRHQVARPEVLSA